MRLYDYNHVNKNYSKLYMGNKMNKIITTLTLVAMSMFGHNALAANLYPSNGIFQEMAGTTDKGGVSIDLYDNSGYRSSVRMGMFNGEVVYTPNPAGAGGPMVGYKYPFKNKKMAAYGLFNFDSVAGTPDLLFGFAYTGGSRSKFMYNANVEVLAPGAAGSVNTVELKAGGYYAIKAGGAGRMYIAGELIMDTNANTTNLFAALRFAPKKNVNIDVGIFTSLSGAGGTSTVGAPLFFRLTLGL